MKTIPQAAPQLRVKRFVKQIERQVTSVLHGGQYIQGSQVSSFEQAFANYIGTAHAVGVNSGTDAIALALQSLGIGDGDEVITTTMTAAGTAIGILKSGATPRLVDIDPATRNLDLDAVEAAVGQRTAAIVPVHLHGMACDMRRIMSIAERHGLAVVEDCAQATGAQWEGRRVGSMGHAAAFSFYPTKNLGCVGDGGMVVTNDECAAQRARALGCYGWKMPSRISEQMGHNSRLDEIQAAILNVLLPKLDEGNAERQEIAARYRQALAPMAETGRVLLPLDAPLPVYHQFAVETDNREQVMAALKSDGILTGTHYRDPLHLQPLFARFATAPLPCAERFANRNISLPIQSEAVSDAVDHIVDSLVRCFVHIANQQAA